MVTKLDCNQMITELEQTLFKNSLHCRYWGNYRYVILRLQTPQKSRNENADLIPFKKL